MALWSSSKLLAGFMAGSKRPGASRKETEVNGDEGGIKKENHQVSRSQYYHPHWHQTKYQEFSKAERSDRQGACIAIVLTNDDGWKDEKGTPAKKKRGTLLCG